MSILTRKDITKKIETLENNNGLATDFLNERYIETPESARDLFYQMLKDGTTFSKNSDITDVAFAFVRCSDLQEAHYNEYIDVENPTQPYLLNYDDLKQLYKDIKEYINNDN